MTMECDSTGIEEILSRFASLTRIDDGKKVRCSLSGHEMPCTSEALGTYVTGKKFLNLHQQNEFDYTQHEPHLMASNDTNHKHHLYCNLTQRYVNKIPEHIERHIAGKRFQRELKRYEESQSKGVVFKPRRKPQKDKGDRSKGDGVKGGATSRLVTDMEQLGMDFIPSDSEAESEDDSPAGKNSGGEAEGMEENNAAAELPDEGNPKKLPQSQNSKRAGFKKNQVRPRIHSSKSRKRKFGASLTGTSGIKQPNKVTRARKKPKLGSEK